MDVNVAPPSPLTMNSMELPAPPAPSNYGTLNSVADTAGRVRSMSPPPPPLPADGEIDVAAGGTISRHRVLPENNDLPGWVPKDYIDKGTTRLSFLKLVFLIL